MTNYDLTINMDKNTVECLLKGDYSLYAFKSVQSSQKGGCPTVWFSTKTFSTKTQINWDENYEAYDSNSEIVPKGKIVASNSVKIDLDQTFCVTSTAGTGSVITGGVPGAISIHNQTTKQFTCGISQKNGTDPTPLCAFPLYGKQLDVIAPIEKVVVMFATATLSTGTVVEKAYSQALQVDLTSKNSRTVNFEINEGWGDIGITDKLIPANANLVPFVIIDSESLKLKSLDVPVLSVL